MSRHKDEREKKRKTSLARKHGSRLELLYAKSKERKASLALPSF